MEPEAFALARRLASAAGAHAARSAATEVVLLDYLVALKNEPSCAPLLDGVSTAVRRDDPANAATEAAAVAFAATITGAKQYLLQFPDLAAAADALNRLRADQPELAGLDAVTPAGLSGAFAMSALRPPSPAVTLVLSRATARSPLHAVAILEEIVRFETEAADGPLTRSDVLRIVQERLTSVRRSHEIP